MALVALLVLLMLVRGCQGVRGLLAIRPVLAKVALASHRRRRPVGRCGRHGRYGAIAVGSGCHDVLGRHALALLVVLLVLVLLNRRRGWQRPGLIWHDRVYRHVVGPCGGVLCPAAPTLGCRGLLVGSHASGFSFQKSETSFCFFLSLGIE